MIRILGGEGVKNKFHSISDELIILHEHLRKKWPKLVRIAVALYDSETDMLHTFIRSSQHKDILNHYSYKLSEISSLLEISQTNKPRIIENLEVLAKSSTQHSQELIANGFHSSFTVPLYLNEHLLGFVFFDATETKYFTTTIQSTLLDYARLLESLVISEVLPIKSIKGLVKTTREITKARDEETGEHLTRMSHYVELIALELAEKYGFSDEEIEYMWFYASLHDIGKIAIPDAILMKPGKLTKEEFKIIKTHVNEGIKIFDMIVKNFDFQKLYYLSILKQIISEHHERLDRSGYPKGLKSNEISIVGKITAVADVFDALSTPRVYHNGLSIKDTFTYLKKHTGTLFDEECVNALMVNEERVREIHTMFPDRFRGEKNRVDS